MELPLSIGFFSPTVKLHHMFLLLKISENLKYKLSLAECSRGFDTHIVVDCVREQTYCFKKL